MPLFVTGAFIIKKSIPFTQPRRIPNRTPYIHSLPRKERVFEGVSLHVWVPFMPFLTIIFSIWEMHPRAATHRSEGQRKKGRQKTCALSQQTLFPLIKVVTGDWRVCLIFVLGVEASHAFGTALISPKRVGTRPHHQVVPSSLGRRQSARTKPLFSSSSTALIFSYLVPGRLKVFNSALLLKIFFLLPLFSFLFSPSLFCVFSGNHQSFSLFLSSHIKSGRITTALLIPYLLFLLLLRGDCSFFFQTTTHRFSRSLLPSHPSFHFFSRTTTRPLIHLLSCPLGIDRILSAPHDSSVRALVPQAAALFVYDNDLTTIYQATQLSIELSPSLQLIFAISSTFN